MGSLSRRGWLYRVPAAERGYAPLGEVESDRFGVVLTARSEVSGALVEIRVLAPSLTADRAFMRRVGRDMRVIREVRHTNLLSVMDFNKRAGAVVYESVRGSTLTRVLEGQGELDLAAGLVLLDDCTAGLQALHNVGVRHRNISTDAVVIETTGAVLLRDAGLWPPETATAAPADRRPYVAPEVVDGGGYSFSADLYAATAAFVAAIGGRASKAGVRADLRALVSLGMATDPSKRSASVGEFRRELDDYARATVGEAWRREGRALLATAATAQATRAIRVSSPSKSAHEVLDDAVAAVAQLRTPGVGHERALIGAGAFALALVAGIAAAIHGIDVSANPGAAVLPPNLNVPMIPHGGPLAGSTSDPGAPTPAPTAPAFTVPGIGGSSGGSDPATDPRPTPNSTSTQQSQTVSFTTTPPSGAYYHQAGYVAAAAATSHLPVRFSASGGACSVGLSGGAVTLSGVGTCTIQAYQAGNTQYSAAVRTESFTVGQAPQTISYTTSPSSPTYGGTYTVAATAAGGPVAFWADPSSVACSVDAAGSVTFTAAGTCIIDANQPGNTDYQAAVPASQQFNVAQASQTINLTSTAPTCPCSPGQQYTVTASGGGSGNPVTFNIDGASTPGICTISGSTITINGGTSGTCIIDAFQAGDQNFSAAAEQQQTINVS